MTSCIACNGRLLALWCVACALVACGKKTAPTQAIVETVTTTTSVATVAPTASASATANTIDIADAADEADDEDASDADDDAGEAAWVTARSTGCLGWNAATRHAVCIVGLSGTGAIASVRAKDVFNGVTTLPWLEAKEGMLDGADDPPPAASVAKVAKLVTRLHLTPLDKSTARKLGPGEELTITTPKKLTLRYKRATHGTETEDSLEVVCTAAPQSLIGATGLTKNLPKESNVELYIDPTSKIGLIVWTIYRDMGVSASVYHNIFYAQGIDFTAQDYCPGFTSL